ncbi:MAG: transcriptional regulator, MerR family [Paenibacillaceae bacterium]|nr:transcriptional regulator, MerR family [Paenibacillaceae bacterium]
MLQIPKDTLRYYDRIGIVSPSRRENRYRKYSRDDLIDLMNIQIMQYADFALDEIRGRFSFHKLDHIDPAYCEEVASFLDAKNAEMRKKIAHLEKVSQLLHTAAATLRDFNHESDQRLTETVREIYQSIRSIEPKIFEEVCNDRQD